MAFRKPGKLGWTLIGIAALLALGAGAFVYGVKNHGLAMLDWADRTLAGTAGARQVRDGQAYGPLPAQQLDVFVPETPGPHPATQGIASEEQGISGSTRALGTLCCAGSALDSRGPARTAVEVDVKQGYKTLLLWLLLFVMLVAIYQISTHNPSVQEVAFSKFFEDVRTHQVERVQIEPSMSGDHTTRSS